MSHVGVKEFSSQMFALPRFILSLKKDQEPIVPAFIGRLASCMPLREHSEYCNGFLMQNKGIMKCISAVETPRRVRNLVSSWKLWDKQNYGKKNIWHWSFIFWQRPKGGSKRSMKSRLGWRSRALLGAAVGEQGGGSAGRSGWAWEHPQPAAPLQVLADPYQGMANAWF